MSEDNVEPTLNIAIDGKAIGKHLSSVYIPTGLNTVTEVWDVQRNNSGQLDKLRERLAEIEPKKTLRVRVTIEHYI